MTAAPSAAPVQDAYDACIEALDALQRAKAHGGVDPATDWSTAKAASNYYERLALTLRAFNAPGNWHRDDTAREPRPRYLAFALGQILDDLVAGRIPLSIKHLFFDKGRPGRHAIQHRAIEAAVRYIVAVEDGLIEDHDAVRQVAEAFDVTRRTARRWVDAYGAFARLALTRHAGSSPCKLKAMLIRHMSENADLYPLDEAPATFWFFHERLRRFHPTQAGLTEHRWQTIKSDVAFALRRIGLSPNQAKPRTPYSDEWTALRAWLISAGLRWGLSRLARFCDARGIGPRQVDDAVITAYGTCIRDHSFKTNPKRHHRDVCGLWNRVVDLMPHLALQRVTLPCYRQTYTPAWDALPPALREEADDWLATMSEEADLLSEAGPIRPLRPASIKSYRYALRQIVAGLQHSGRPLETIASLAALVEPDAAKTALQFFLDRNGGKPSTMIAMIAHVLVLVATTAVRADTQTLATLKLYRKRLTRRPTGLRPRPRQALRPFADRANIEKLLLLPQRLGERLRRKADHSLADARLMQVALALELLQMRPIRRKNLVALRLGEHVIRSGGRTFILIEEEEIKNRVEHDYPIPPESVRLLDFYREHLLPLFGDNPSGFLLPGEVPGRAKSGEQFGRFFTKVIREETGLHVYPHLLRHFGATLYLSENPNGLEVVRRVLGHRSADTTARSYAGCQDEAAMRAFDGVILRIRATILKEIGGE